MLNHTDGPGATKDRAEAIGLASRLWTSYRDKLCFFDTETTGVDGQAEACEVSIIDGYGRTLLNTLVKPVGKVSHHAFAVHGITDDMLRGAPTMAQVQPELFRILKAFPVPMAYNAPFDCRIVRQSLQAVGMGHYTAVFDWLDQASKCVMAMYSKYASVWDPRYGAWRKHKLGDAAKAFGVSVEGAHRAMADIQMTKGVFQGIAEAKSN
jgi:DNA polymerase-3 subunit epsilon